jgi:hypothetical protein
MYVALELPYVAFCPILPWAMGLGICRSNHKVVADLLPVSSH